MFFGKSNQTILHELDKLVYGHREAKITLINLINRSKLRYYQKFVEGRPDSELINNMNCLLIGDSGTGKTHLVQSLAKVCQFPLVCLDANQLAPTSANGTSASDIIRLIKRNAMEELNNTKNYHSQDGAIEQTVVFIDEIDKLAKAFDSSGKWNKHVQANFLTLFENNNELEGVSFVFAGAFSDLEYRPEDSNKKSIGFHTGDINNAPTEIDLEQEIVKYGLLPELIGRIHNIIVLDKLEYADYENILTKRIIPIIQKELYEFNVTNFKLSSKEKDNIINKALKSKMGVRVLRKEVLQLSKELEFDYEYSIDDLDSNQEDALIQLLMANNYKGEEEEEEEDQ